MPAVQKDNQIKLTDPSKHQLLLTTSPESSADPCIQLAMILPVSCVVTDARYVLNPWEYKTMLLSLPLIFMFARKCQGMYALPTSRFHISCVHMDEQGAPGTEQ